MSVIYRPVLIESAEQAEALPIGTLAAPMYEDGPDFVYALVRREETYEPWCNSDGSHARGHGELDGFVALVPIETEEEWGVEVREGGDPDDAHVIRAIDRETAEWRLDTLDVPWSRVVHRIGSTPWEEPR